MRPNLFRLTPRQRRRLRALMTSTADTSSYRRALALLERDQGNAVEQVAAMMGLHRSTISAWWYRCTLESPTSRLARCGLR